MRLLRSCFLILFALTTLGAAPAWSADTGQSPAWFRAQLDFFTRGSGVFHADNAKYVSEAESSDTYVLEFTTGPSGATLHGRLYGMRDGAASETIWEYLMYWDPSTSRIAVHQVGADGTVGRGSMIRSGSDDTSWIEQIQTGPDGSTSEIAHSARDVGDVHDTVSYLRRDDQWVAGRRYTWIRQPQAQKQGD